MNAFFQRLSLIATVVAIACVIVRHTPACCPAGPRGKPVVNADQTVVMIWDAAAKTQHFIRQASFKSAAVDFAFLVPTPSQPELDESGDEAFRFLSKLTEPEVRIVPQGGINCGCGRAGMKAPAAGAVPVRVLERKLVAGFNAVVLETKSSADLVAWLKDNGYAFSPEVETWAKPYVEQGWKITALKVAGGKDAREPADVAAAALRISFKTDAPIFPYREPDSATAAADLGARRRLLRIYFVSEARYDGNLTPEVPWTGKVAWSGKLKQADRLTALQLLKLPATTGPAEWWLTEFEDPWPYQKAPADVHFARSVNQDPLAREPIIQYVSSPWPTDITAYALAVCLFSPPLLLRLRRSRSGLGK